MARELKVDLQGRGLRVAVVVSRFNRIVTDRLLEGALEGLAQHGVEEDDILVSWVPGSFELPVIARNLAQTHRFDSIICLGAVIRGETSHFDLVAGQAAGGISRVAIDTGVPVMFGVLATDNMDQALNRAGGKSGNVGYNVAVAAIEMARLRLAIKGLEGSS